MEKTVNQVSRRRILNAVALGATSTAAYSTAHRAASPPAENGPGGVKGIPWPMEHADARATNSVPSGQSPATDRISEKWSVEVESENLLPPVANNDGLIVATGRPKISATSIDLETGDRQWESEIDETTHAPPVAEENNVFVAFDRAITSRASDSGNREGKPETPVPESAFLFVDLVATDDHLLFTAESGVLGAIGHGENTIGWLFEVEYTPVKVAATADTVYLVTKGTPDGCERAGRIHAVDLSSGREVWSESLPSGAREVGVADGAVVVGIVGGLHAFDPDSGTRLWKRDTKTGSPGFAIQDDVIVSGGYRHVSAVDWRSGETEWEKQFDSNFISPAISGDTVFVVGSGEKGTNWETQIKNLDLASGRQKATHHLNEERLYGPVVANKSLYVSTDSGNVYAFNGGK